MILKEHLLFSTENEKYLSKTVQNKIIETCHKLTRDKNQAEISLVLADGSNIKQFSICI